MLFINRLTSPGDIRRLELRLDTVKVVLQDGTERLYRSIERERECTANQTDYGSLDAVADRRED